MAYAATATAVVATTTTTVVATKKYKPNKCIRICVVKFIGEFILDCTRTILSVFSGLKLTDVK